MGAVALGVLLDPRAAGPRQARGKSAGISARLISAWRASRRRSRGGRSSPFFGRPRLRRASVFFFLGLRSRASIAVPSREMWPTRRSACVFLMSAS